MKSYLSTVPESMLAFILIGGQHPVFDVSIWLHVSIKIHTDNSPLIIRSRSVTEVSPNFKQSDKERLELYRMIFDNLHTGAIVTDVNGIVTHLNKPYADFLGLSVAECIGKHCTDLVESSRMHIVARTGQPGSQSHADDSRAQYCSLPLSH